MKYRLRLFLTIAAVAFIIPLLMATAYAGDTSPIVWYTGENDSIKVETQNQGAYYLFLPSSADFSALRISVPRDTVFSGEVYGQTIAVPKNQITTVNLSMLFFTMTEGEAYCLQLQTDVGWSTVVLMKSANLSSMHIEIAGDLKQVNSSEDKSVSFPGIYSIVSPDGIVSASGSIDQFKGRGNSSWVRSGGKQPYNLKLSQSTELISGAGKSKRWCLVSENVSKHDLTGLSNLTAMQLYRDLGGEYALDSTNIDLYVNGEYRGMYMLSEKVTFSDGVIDIPDTVYYTEDKQNSTMVVQPSGVTKKPAYWDSVPLRGDNLTVINLNDASEDPAIAAGIQAYKYCDQSSVQSQSGYLIELDFRFYEEEAWFVTRRGVAVVLCDPEYPGREEVQRIAMYVQRFEDALFSADGFNSQGDYYGDLLDLDSQAKMYLLDSFICNRDAHRASTYYYTRLNENGDIAGLFAGPAWDYNSVDMSAVHYFGNDIGTNAYNIIWMTQLASHGDFLYMLNSMNSDVLIPLIDNLLDTGFDGYISRLSASQKMNGILWNNSFKLNADQYKEALVNRNNIWRTVLWTQDKLLGVSLTRKGGTLMVNTAGSASSLTWYMYDEGTHTLQVLPNVTGTEYTPDTPGIYCVSVYGNSIIYNARSAIFMSDYSPNGMASFSTIDLFTAYSNPIDTRLPEKVEPTPTPLPEAEPQQTEAPATDEPVPEATAAPEPTVTPVAEPGPTEPVTPESSEKKDRSGLIVGAVLIFGIATVITTAVINSRHNQGSHTGKKRR